MAAETQYTVSTAFTTISTANSNLDGSGTLGTVITGASNGTLIKTITIKAQETTTEGIVRLFVYDGSNTKLLQEIHVPSVTQSAINPSFGITIPLYFTLKSGYQLKASTENAETFNVIAEAQDWIYYGAAVRPDTTKYIVSDRGTTISTANPNLDGTGTGAYAFSPPNNPNGANIWSITIKAQGTTTQGMIRLGFWDGNSQTKIFMEVPVDAIVPSATTPSFYKKISFANGFALTSQWRLWVATEKAETFNIIAEGVNIKYPVPPS